MVFKRDFFKLWKISSARGMSRVPRPGLAE
jgi:hypothetical protein